MRRALVALLALLPLVAVLTAFASSTGFGGANIPQGLSIQYVSSSPTFVLPVDNQGYSTVTVTVSVNGQAVNVTLPPYSYKLLQVQLAQGRNTIVLGNERLTVVYNYSQSAVNPTAYINGSANVIAVNARPGQALTFFVTANLPSQYYYLSPLQPVTDMEVGPQYSAFYQLVSANEVQYGVVVPQGIAQGLYTVYFPIQVMGVVKVNSTVYYQPVGFTWALAVINVSYGISPFSSTNSTKPFGSGELAQFVIKGFNPNSRYYVVTSSGSYEVGLMSAQYTVMGQSASVTYFGSSLQVAVGSDGIVVYIPNYSGPVQLSTSPVPATTSTSTTTSSTTTTSTATSSTTTTTTSTSTSSTTTTTTSTSTTTSSTTTTTSAATATTTSSSTTSTASAAPAQTTPPTVTPQVSGQSSALTYVVIGVIVIIVVVAAVLLLRR
mgnify:CR=1 FL=1